MDTFGCAEKSKSEPSITSFDLVIFDCDGVLVDSEIIAANTLSRLLARRRRDHGWRRVGSISRQDFRERRARVPGQDWHPAAGRFRTALSVGTRCGFPTRTEAHCRDSRSVAHAERCRPPHLPGIVKLAGEDRNFAADYGPLAILFGTRLRTPRWCSGESPRRICFCMSRGR